MRVQQLSVFIENKSGRLAQVMRTLADEGVNIRALSIADTSDFGILRLIVDHPDKGLACLKAAGFAVSETAVIAVVVDDRPGGLADILDALKLSSVDLEYMYAFVGRHSGEAVVVLRAEDSDRAAQALISANIRVLSGADVYA